MPGGNGFFELLRKPLSAETPRTLLATIVRRLAHKQRRSEHRMKRREREQQSPDPLPSPREILEREETRARVVLTLPEPGSGPATWELDLH